MADISYKNKKFPLKAVPTISLAFIVAAISSISVMYFLDDDENFLDLNEFEVQEIEYEFQTILEEDSFNNLDIFSKFNALNSFHSVPIMIADDPSQAS